MRHRFHRLQATLSVILATSLLCDLVRALALNVSAVQISKSPYLAPCFTSQAINAPAVPFEDPLAETAAVSVRVEEAEMLLDPPLDLSRVALADRPGFLAKELANRHIPQEHKVVHFWKLYDELAAQERKSPIVTRIAMGETLFYISDTLKNLGRADTALQAAVQGLDLYQGPEWARYWKWESKAPNIGEWVRVISRLRRRKASILKMRWEMTNTARDLLEAAKAYEESALTPHNGTSESKQEKGSNYLNAADLTVLLAAVSEGGEVAADLRGRAGLLLRAISKHGVDFPMSDYVYGIIALQKNQWTRALNLFEKALPVAIELNSKLGLKQDDNSNRIRVAAATAVLHLHRDTEAWAYLLQIPALGELQWPASLETARTERDAIEASADTVAWPAKATQVAFLKVLHELLQESEDRQETYPDDLDVMVDKAIEDLHSDDETRTRAGLDVVQDLLDHNRIEDTPMLSEVIPALDKGFTTLNVPVEVRSREAIRLQQLAERRTKDDGDFAHLPIAQAILLEAAPMAYALIGHANETREWDVKMAESILQLCQKGLDELKKGGEATSHLTGRWMVARMEFERARCSLYTAQWDYTGEERDLRKAVEAGTAVRDIQVELVKHDADESFRANSIALTLDNLLELLLYPALSDRKSVIGQCRRLIAALESLAAGESGVEFNKARFALRSGDPQKAIDLLNPIWDATQDPAERLVIGQELLESHFTAGHYETAEAFIAPVMEGFASALAFFYAGEVYFHNPTGQNLEQAKTYWEKALHHPMGGALKASGNDRLAARRLAQIYLHTGPAEKATEDLLAAISSANTDEELAKASAQGILTPADFSSLAARLADLSWTSATHTFIRQVSDLLQQAGYEDSRKSLNTYFILSARRAQEEWKGSEDWQKITGAPTPSKDAIGSFFRRNEWPKLPIDARALFLAMWCKDAPSMNLFTSRGPSFATDLVAQVETVAKVGAPANSTDPLADESLVLLYQGVNEMARSSIGQMGIIKPRVTTSAGLLENEIRRRGLDPHADLSAMDAAPVAGARRLTERTPADWRQAWAALNPRTGLPTFFDGFRSLSIADQATLLIEWAEAIPTHEYTKASPRLMIALANQMHRIVNENTQLPDDVIFGFDHAIQHWKIEGYDPKSTADANAAVGRLTSPLSYRRALIALRRVYEALHATVVLLKAETALPDFDPLSTSFAERVSTLRTQWKVADTECLRLNVEAPIKGVSLAIGDLEQIVQDAPRNRDIWAAVVDGGIPGMSPEDPFRTQLLDTLIRLNRTPLAARWNASQGSVAAVHLMFDALNTYPQLQEGLFIRLPRMRLLGFGTYEGYLEWLFGLSAIPGMTSEEDLANILVQWAWEQENIRSWERSASALPLQAAIQQRILSVIASNGTNPMDAQRQNMNAYLAKAPIADHKLKAVSAGNPVRSVLTGFPFRLLLPGNRNFRLEIILFHHVLVGHNPAPLILQGERPDYWNILVDPIAWNVPTTGIEPGSPFAVSLETAERETYLLASGYSSEQAPTLAKQQQAAKVGFNRYALSPIPSGAFSSWIQWFREALEGSDHRHWIIREFALQYLKWKGIKNRSGLPTPELWSEILFEVVQSHMAQLLNGQAKLPTVWAAAQSWAVTITQLIQNVQQALHDENARAQELYSILSRRPEAGQLMAQAKSQSIALMGEATSLEEILFLTRVGLVYLDSKSSAQTTPLTRVERDLLAMGSMFGLRVNWTSDQPAEALHIGFVLKSFFPDTYAQLLPKAHRERTAA